MFWLFNYISTVILLTMGHFKHIPSQYILGQFLDALVIFDKFFLQRNGVGVLICP